jgi:hypothetical protein
MPEYTGQVLGVSSKSVGAKQTTQYTIAFSNGNSYSTFDYPVAQKAQIAAASGTTVTLVTALKPKRDGNGYWENADNILTENKSLGGQSTIDTSQAASLPPIPVEAPQNGNGGVSGASKFREPEQIARQEALAVAFNYASQADMLAEEAFALAGQIFETAYNGLAFTAPPSSPEEIAAAVPGVSVGVGSAGTGDTPEW